MAKRKRKLRLTVKGAYGDIASQEQKVREKIAEVNHLLTKKEELEGRKARGSHIPIEEFDAIMEEVLYKIRRIIKIQADIGRTEEKLLQTAKKKKKLP